MSKRKTALLIFLGVLILIGAVIYAQFLQRRAKIPLIKIGEIQKISENNANAPRLSTLADNLEVPWALVFLPASPPASQRGEQGGPDKSILFTERPGRVRFIDSNGNLNPNPIAVIEDVKQSGEGGLLGITIHPDFSNNHLVYLYYTYADNNGPTLNRVVRFKFEDNTLSQKTIIVDKIPGNVFHDGGRIKFGPDGFLYITTGDSQNPSLAQDKKSLAGKILRVTDEGKPAPGNPFKSPVFSYGHRNPQGITWDPTGRLWETEHGPSNAWPDCCKDELNIIQKGKNYGWPKITDGQTQKGMETPIINSNFDTWAPSGAAYLNGSIFFGGLRGQALYEAVINGDKVTIKEHMKGEVGRIRDVVVGPNNLLYITTSNRDGRGIPDATDDKIIRVNPAKFKTK